MPLWSSHIPAPQMSGTTSGLNLLDLLVALYQNSNIRNVLHKLAPHIGSSQRCSPSHYSSIAGASISFISVRYDAMKCFIIHHLAEPHRLLCWTDTDDMYIVHRPSIISIITLPLRRALDPAPLQWWPWCLRCAWKCRHTWNVFALDRSREKLIRPQQWQEQVWLSRSLPDN